MLDGRTRLAKTVIQASPTTSGGRTRAVGDGPERSPTTSSRRSRPAEDDTRNSQSRVETTELSSPSIWAKFQNLGEGQSLASSSDLPHLLYKRAYFKTLLSLLSLLAVGSPAGFLSETLVAYTTRPRPTNWTTRWWGFQPDFLATFLCVALTIIMAIVWPLLHRGLID